MTVDTSSPPANLRLRRLILRTIAGSLSLCAAIAVLAILTGSLDDTAGKVIATTSGVAGYALLALPAGLLLDRGRSRPLPRWSLALAGAGLALWVVAVWSSFDVAGLAKTLLITTSFAFAATDAAALSLVDAAARDERVRKLRTVSVTAAFLAATLVTLAALTEIGGSGYYRVLSAVVIVALLAALLVPIAVRIGRIDRDAERRFSLRIVAEPGGERTVSVKADDLADAIAQAVRDVERAGGRVVRIEPLA
ncbi:MAG: hypothetical protein HYX33_02180 [Actinobacteria bacterium]|nr:hypothetical protein [Actinomycetota bacterium]